MPSIFRIRGDRVRHDRLDEYRQRRAARRRSGKARRSARSRFDSSLASDHGSLEAMYRFVAEITSQISRSAIENWNDSPMRDCTDGSTREAAASAPQSSAAVAGSGTTPPQVPMHHGRGATDQISQVVGQIGVVTRQKGRVDEVGVVAERHLPQAEIPEERRRRTPSWTPAAARRCRATWTSWRRSSATSRGRRCALGSGRPAAIRNAGQIHGVKTRRSPSPSGARRQARTCRTLP